MPVLPFGEWLPDRAALNNPGVLVARNVLPGSGGYLPVPSLAVQTDALEARPRGAVRVRNNAGTALSFAGDAEKLYQLTGGTWNDVSNVGGYTTGQEERWEFTTFGSLLIATNFSDTPQVFDLDTGIEFTELTDAFSARAAGTLRNFVLMGNTFDGIDGEVRNRIRWCAFNNPFDWTPDPATLSDFEDLLTGGEVRRIVGGEFGLIFQQSAVRRITFVGAPTVFQIDEVLPEIGLLAPGALVQDGRVVYFLSPRGFLSLTDGVGLRQIGAEKIDRTVLSDIDADYLHRISAALDPNTQRVYFAYPGAGNTNGRPNRVVVYDVALDRWSLVEMDVELMWVTGGASIDIDTTDPATPDDDILDAVTVSLDSSRYKGSGRAIAAFNGLFQSGSFEGPALNARIETGDREEADARFTRLSAFRVLVEGTGTVAPRIGTRNDMNDAVTLSPVLTKTRTGRFTINSNARYQRLRVDLSGSWTRAVGLQVGEREARPGSRL